MSAYGDYYNYSAHSDYSDAYERKKKELAAKEQDLADTKRDIDKYVSENISSFLRSTAGISDIGFMKTKQDGDYDEIAYDASVKAAINNSKEKEMRAETDEYDSEIKKLEALANDLEGVKKKYGEE